MSGNLPGPNLNPTYQDTQRFIQNTPNLRNLSPDLQQAIIYNRNNQWLNSPILPNGTNNPLYQNGQLTPNWYVPSTWSSPQMSWQGVQPTGYLPSSSFNYPTSTSYISAPSSYSSLFPSNSLPPTPAYNPVPAATSLGVATAYQQQQMQASMATLSKTLAQTLTHFRDDSQSYIQFDVSRALRQAAIASSLHEAAGDKVAQAVDHSELARIFLQGDKPEEALAQIRIAEPLAEASGDRPLEIGVLRLKAAALMSSGEFEKAVSIYRNLVNRLGAIRDESGQAETEISLAWALQSLGQAHEAFIRYGNAFKLFQKAGNRDGETRSMIGVATLYGSMGDFDHAGAQYRQAGLIASDDQFARILVSFAALLQSRDMHRQALLAYEKASSLAAVIKDQSLSAAILTGMGRSHMANGDFIAARRDFEHAEAQMNDAGNRAGLAGVLACIAELDYRVALFYSDHQVMAKAAAGYSKALTLIQSAGDRTGEAGILTGLGLVYEAGGQRKKAMNSYRHALAILDDLRASVRLEEFRIDVAGQSENLYKHMVDLEVHSGHMEEAFNLSERARARTFLDMLGNGRVPLQRGASADFADREDHLRNENVSLERQLAQEYSKPISEVDKERLHSLETRLAGVRDRYEQSIEQLKAGNPTYASFLSISPLNLRQAQEQLAPGFTLLSYYTMSDKTLAFVITHDSFRAFRIPVTEEKLALAVNTLLDFASEDNASPFGTLLYKTLIGPLKSVLKNHSLVIAPYGVLNNLPFAALSPDGKQFLGDTFSITLLPSISAWPYLQIRKQVKADHALVLAADDVQGLPLLPSGHEEAMEIASMLGTAPLFGNAVTSSTLLEHGAEYSIVHLMAHVDSGSPRIDLGTEEGKTAGLDIRKVLGLDLHSAELVVLSGCQSQKGRRTRGDDVIALSRAFMYAGSRSVVASLWDVDDEATRQLMVAFYSHLHSGMSKAGALQAAQKDLRAKFPNPYYWAPFVLMGDPGPIPN